AAARFNGPVGIAADGAGNLYVADGINDTVRKIVIATGAVTTLAGAPGQAGSADGAGAAARFDAPAGIATDGAANLYVAAAPNAPVRKIAVATASVTTLAGAPVRAGSTDVTFATAPFNYPYAVTTDGSGNLYVADTQNGAVRKVVIATGAVTT